jgi:GNAT superfamily N-acetyltransferase
MTDLIEVSDGTWPAAADHSAGAFRVREGLGGGQRVSSATSSTEWSAADIGKAEDMHRQLGQRPLFMIRPGDEALDAALEARGYVIVDPVNLYECATDELIGEIPHLSAFPLWPPLAIMRDIWADGGIGAGRIAVMNRSRGPKTAILGRANDRPSGAAFVAIHQEVAMLHALYIVTDQRRHKSAVNIMRCAAKWAQDHGAKRFSVLVTAANIAANALYSSLGMGNVGQYHYRSISPEEARRAVEGRRSHHHGA